MARKMYEEPVEKELNSILKKYKVYEDLTPIHAKYLYEKFIESANSAYLVYLSGQYPKGLRLSFCNKDVYTIVEQVWKRKVYFRVFHEGVKGMNELKETALYCFWILKLQPFHIYGGADSMNKLNARMALYFLVAGGLAYTADMNSKNVKNARAANSETAQELKLNVNQTILNDMFYSFQFRDWSKEALMDLYTGLIMSKDVKV